MRHPSQMFQVDRKLFPSICLKNIKKMLMGISSLVPLRTLTIKSLIEKDMESFQPTRPSQTATQDENKDSTLNNVSIHAAFTSCDFQDGMKELLKTEFQSTQLSQAVTAIFHNLYHNILSKVHKAYVPFFRIYPFKSYSTS